MSNVYVIGAGIVGVSCALNLLEKGINVTLIDRTSEVKETSFGNAGVIARSSAYLMNNKKLIPNLRHYIFNKHRAVRLDYGYLLKHSNWALQFLTQSLERHSETNISHLDSLIKVSLTEHKKWLAQSNQLARLREDGWLKLFRTAQGVEGTAYEQSIYQRLGIDFEVINAEQIQALEPALKSIYGSGLHIKDAASVDHPGEVTQGYMDLFVRLGGRVVQDEIKQLSREGDWFVLHGEHESYRADKLVLAAGPWSNDLLKTLAKPLPMCFERGYHEHYSIPEGPALKRPLYDVDNAFVITPTTKGYRLSSGSELQDKNAPASPNQLRQIAAPAHEALNIGERITDSLWKGNRPTLPDSLPAIGPHPQLPNLWLAFGHQHIGFSTGPATGRLIAEMITRERTFINETPFAPARFL